MDLKQVNEEIEKINSYLRNCLWMDFEVCQMSFIKVEIAGQIDTSSNKYAISIEFEQPHFISGLLCWSLDNSKDFISMASPSEFIEYNEKFRIDNGKYLFKIRYPCAAPPFLRPVRGLWRRFFQLFLTGVSSGSPSCFRQNK